MTPTLTNTLLSAAIFATASGFSSSAVAATAGLNVTARDGSITVAVSADGITGAWVAGETLPSLMQSLVNASGKTKLQYGDQCYLSPSTCIEAPGGARLSAVEDQAVVAQDWSCTIPTTPGNTTVVMMTVIDVFAPAAFSVTINTTVAAANQTAPAFTSALLTGLHWAAAPDPATPAPQIWLPWSKGCTTNDGTRSSCRGVPNWQNPLVPEPLLPAFYEYGKLGRNANDSFSIPLGSVLDPTADAAVTLALSVDDPMLEVAFETLSSGVRFRREFLRLGPAPVRFTAHLVGHRADWRPALHFMLKAFPDYFVSTVEGLDDFEGLGGYTWNLTQLDPEHGRKLGFKTNWDLSGTFMPYDGLFLPYQEEPWLNLGPINGGLKQYNVTYPMIDAYYRDIQAKGFHSLSYFDIGNWGLSVTTTYRGPNTTCGVRPNGMPAPCPDWAGAQEYLRDHLFDALLHHGWDLGAGRFMVHHDDWVGTTWMDTQEPDFEDLIVEQLERHLIKFPLSFEGIAIDRMDYSEAYNYDKDDNLSWVPRAPSPGANPTGRWPYTANWTFGPARSNRLSYRHTYARLHEVLKKARGGKGGPMLNNCNALGNVCRLDLLKHFDGTFSEGSALNAAAFTGLRTPTIQWTYGLSDDRALLSAYLQQHLLMDAYPMAPIPFNDHSIQPGSAAVDQAYFDYAPLFDAMHGAKWLLSTRAVGVRTSNAIDDSTIAVNIFTVGGAASGGGAVLPALLVPVMLANSSTTQQAVLTLNLAPTASELGWPAVHGIANASALHPNASAAVALAPATSTPGVAASWQLTVPLREGCALVRVELA